MGELRQKLYKFVKEIGYTIPVITEQSSIISSTAVIGEGTFIGKGAVVNEEAGLAKWQSLTQCRLWNMNVLPVIFHT